jgi:hypothetical protein
MLLQLTPPFAEMIPAGLALSRDKSDAKQVRRGEQ